VFPIIEGVKLICEREHIQAAEAQIALLAKPHVEAQNAEHVTACLVPSFAVRDGSFQDSGGDDFGRKMPGIFLVKLLPRALGRGV
jgi:hypothetical protein